ncbi:MAG: hypothetical protein HQK81_14195 [Desulfovibrionaceae bacterium]|nr:hypothetical protein [Desulfovibrionaceae bacterium]MBF0515194.1 hypothetical protein [Desulfovibrionaceae bacterium]
MKKFSAPVTPFGLEHRHFRDGKTLAFRFFERPGPAISMGRRNCFPRSKHSLLRIAVKNNTPIHDPGVL